MSEPNELDDQNNGISPTSDLLQNHDSAHSETPTNEVINQAKGSNLPSIRGTIRKLRMDCVYRQKMMHTAVICWSFVGLGWAGGMGGPVFPDLQQIINEDLATSSWMFTTGGCGYLFGSLTGGAIYDKFNKIILLAVSSTGLGMSLILTPFCSTLPLMLFIKFVGGLFCAFLDTGANTDILQVWKTEAASYMQALHFGFSFGALLSPFTTEPFLAKEITICSELITNNSNFENLTSSNALLSKSENTPIPQFMNVSGLSEANSSFQSCYITFGETRIFYAYLLSAIISLTASVGYIYLYIKQTKLQEFPDLKDVHDTNSNQKPANRLALSLCNKILFLVLLSTLFASYCVIEDSFSSFLMTFSLTHLKWDKSTGSFATSAFWSSFGIGRFLGIFIVSCCDNSRVLTTYLLLLCIGIIGFLISTIFLIVPLIWIFIAVLGFSMSVIFPLIFTWTSNNVIHVSGKISSIFLVSASVCGMSFPLLIGNLMEYYGPLWYVYLLVIMMAICLSIFTCVRVLAKFCLKNPVLTGTAAEEKEMGLMMT